MLAENEALKDALHSWISVPWDDGRYVLANSYDSGYFTVEGALP
jgi:hypothetical protein